MDQNYLWEIKDWIGQLWMVSGELGSMAGMSDHRLVIVEMDLGGSCPLGRRGSPPFGFEAGWIEEEQCGEIVNNAWKLSMEVRGGKVREALQVVALDLQDCSRNVLGDLEKRIKRTRRALEERRRGPLSKILQIEWSC